MLATTSNECKRRKVKCDGKQPCGQCSNQLAHCSYHARPQDNNNNLVDWECVNPYVLGQFEADALRTANFNT